MKYNNHIFKYALLIVLSLFISCANMVTPTGGEKDSTPPYLLKSIPKNQSTDFIGKKIELEFNEYINIKDIQSQIIFSPGDINVDVKKQGRKLVINLDKEPAEKTTYVLNFGDAISDYTENNVSKDFKFIFSTDVYIDSLQIKGEVVSAYKKDKVKDAIVLLYINKNDDSLIYKRKPDYSTRTNQNGEFIFTNLKKADYKIYALKESNSNKIYDALDEEVAFYDSVISLDSNLKLSSLNLFKEIPKEVKLLNKNISNKKVELIYNTSTKTRIINEDKNIDTIIYSNNNDSIIVYYKEQIDTSFIYTLNDDKLDTLKIKFLKNYKKSDLKLSLENKIIDNNIIIKSADYFSIYKSDSIILKEDTLNVKFKIKRISYNKYIIEYTFNKDKKYVLSILDSAFNSYQNTTNKRFINNIVLYRKEELGNLKLNNIKSNCIYELLNENLDVVRKTIIKDQKSIEYINLIPGNYKLRIIKDLNKNGKWDTGNLLKRIQAEEVNYFLNPIKVRANWDMEIDIIP